MTGATRSRSTSPRRSSAPPGCRRRPRAARFRPRAPSAARAASARARRSTTPTGCSSHWRGTPPASLSTRIPAASGDVRGFKSLSLGAAVNFFDPRNPPRGTDAIWNPGLTTQDFTIALVDKAGKEGVVAASSPRYGTALHQTTGSTTARTHIVLNQIRVPLSDFAAQGVDLGNLRKLELRFGGAGKPATGSIQLSDVRFQEAASRPDGLHRQARRRAADSRSAGPAGRARSSSRSATAPASASAPAGKCATASASLGSTRVVKRRLTLSGTIAACAASVRITITRVGANRHSTTVRAKLASTRWSAGNVPRPRPLHGDGRSRRSGRREGGGDSRTKTVTVR